MKVPARPGWRSRLDSLLLVLLPSRRRLKLRACAQASDAYTAATEDVKVKATALHEAENAFKKHEDELQIRDKHERLKRAQNDLTRIQADVAEAPWSGAE